MEKTSIAEQRIFELDYEINSFPTQEQDWNEQLVTSLDPNSFRMLLDNKVSSIRIPNFASYRECEDLVKSASKVGFSAYRDVVPKINKLGLTAFEYDKISKEKYFEDRQAAVHTQYSVFEQSFDPLQRMHGLIRDRTNYFPRIAEEKGFGKYYAGLIRRIEEGTLLHIDYAPIEQSHWNEITTVKHQLAWNLYLRVSNPDEGHTSIYNKLWDGQDEAYKGDSYGYDPALVSGHRKAQFKPVTGDVVIFNTQNFHQVDPTEGERVTFTSAMGTLANNELIFWS